MVAWSGGGGGRKRTETVYRGAKDMSVPKRRHFVALKHVRETASYLNDGRDPFKGSHVSPCAGSALVRPPKRGWKQEMVESHILR